MVKEKSKKILQKIVIGFIALAVIFVFDFWLFSPREFSTLSTTYQENQEPDYQEPASIEDPTVESTVETEEEEVIEEEESFLAEIKPAVNLSVPFAIQAPLAEWDDLHNEACEEAVLIIAKYWLNNQELTTAKAEQEILDSVKWQEENWGGHYDLNVAETVRLANQYFNIEKIYYTSVKSLNDIKYQLSQGNLVITPMAGRMLDNPYYRQPGPVYHMLVVKGYNEEEIITNDPGTRRGADFSYLNDVFLRSIHDWPFSLKEKQDLSKDEKAQEILKGEKMMIVVEKE